MRTAAHSDARADGSRRGARGFTLVELLVAIAIFVTVMASVALVFNGAIRTSKQGFQNQEAYELARGAMKVIERDLSRAFTNRNRGDVFNFYGTPIGFTYVGLVSADESSAPNMARVTYVIYHDEFNALAGAVAQYETKDSVPMPTYYLLRFVEPGADTLDSFPIPWTEFIDQDGLNVRLQDVIDQRVAASGCPDAACESLIAQSTQREIWIKMLSGGHPADLNDPSSSAVPNAWTELDYFLDRNPIDYVIAENVRFPSLDDSPVCAANRPALYQQLEDAGITIDFDDIEFDSGTDACVRFVSANLDAPVIYDSATLQFSRAVFSTIEGARPFFTYWDIGVRPQLTDPDDALFSDPDNVITANDKIAPIAFQFWNDWRNLLEDGVDNDNDNALLLNNGVDDNGDGVIDDPYDGVDEPDEALLRFEARPGSPLDTRLPIAVTVDLTLFFRTPYPGAPDFNERFTQRIDLPTAYRRAVRQRMPDTP